MILLLALDALAHPFGASSASHRTEVVLEPDVAHVQYTAEVPDAVVRANAQLRPGADPVQLTTTELVSGLVLTVDGAAVPLVVQGPATVHRHHDAHSIGLAFRAPLPTSAREIVLSNGNLPEVPAHAWWTVHVGPGLEVVASRVSTDRWIAGDDGRRAAITLRREGLPQRITAALLARPAAPRPLAVAGPSPGQAWRSGSLSPLGLAGMVLLAFLAGMTIRARVGAVLPLLGGAIGALLPVATWAWVDIVAGSLAVVASASPVLGIWVAVAALTTTAHAWPLALLVCAVALLGTLLRPRLPDALAHRGGRALLWLIGAWVLVRGVVALLAAP